MEDLLIRRDRHRPGGIDDPVEVRLGHLAVLDGGDPVGTQAADMAAGDTGMNGMDLAAGHQLRLFHGPLDGLDSRFNIDYDPAFEAPGGMHPHPHDLHQAVLPLLADEAGNLGGPDIESHQ